MNKLIERSSELARVQTGGVAEPHLDFGMDATAIDCDHLQSTARLSRAEQDRFSRTSGPALVASIAFVLIADIDGPRAGIIRVMPQNLIAISQSMKAP